MSKPGEDAEGGTEGEFDDDSEWDWEREGCGSGRGTGGLTVSGTCRLALLELAPVLVPGTLEDDERELDGARFEDDCFII